MFEYGDSRTGEPMMIDNNPDRSRAHLVELNEQHPNQYWQIKDAGGGLHTVSSAGRCLTATASRQDVASLGCDGRAEQKWRLDSPGDPPPHRRPPAPPSRRTRAAGRRLGACTSGATLLTHLGEQGACHRARPGVDARTVVSRRR
ncbi:hypothetical protein VR45_27365 [Streptomyces sp. NRRL S-495]|nr:hypothetical protein VR45_27365 [Streptomyces sp. NRRL S-495]